MSCYNPCLIQIYQTNIDDKKRIKFHSNLDYDSFKKLLKTKGNEGSMSRFFDKKTNTWVDDFKYKCLDVVQVPCGDCLGCAMQSAKNWATRLICEHFQNIEDGYFGFFFTFTYNEQFCPKQLSVSTAQELVKKIKLFCENHDMKFRYYLCGEYGGKSGRPHYHLCLWLWPGLSDFTLNLQQRLLNGNLWPFGFIHCDVLNSTSIAYVARYSVKKQVLGRSVRKILNHDGVQTEFSLKSRGIGDKYFINHLDEILSNSGEIHFPIEDNSYTSKPIDLVVERRFKKICDKLGRTDDYIKFILNNQKFLSSLKRQELVNSSRGDWRRTLADNERIKKMQLDSLKRM